MPKWWLDGHSSITAALTGRRNGTFRSTLPNATTSSLGREVLLKFSFFPDGPGTPIPVSTLVKDLGVQTANLLCPSTQCTEAVSRAPSVSVFKERLEKVWTEVFPHLTHWLNIQLPISLLYPHPTFTPLINSYHYLLLSFLFYTCDSFRPVEANYLPL